MKRTFTLILFLLIGFYQTLNAQAPTWDWARSAGGDSIDYSRSVCTDLFGNVIITGYFDGPSITFGITTLTNIGGRDIYIAKYDANGNLLWAKSAGGNSRASSFGISTDANGNIFITGYFYSPSITFGTTILTSTGAEDIFIAKYDPNGNVLWAKRAGGNSIEVGNCITTDTSGNVFISGYFGSATITFDTISLINAGGEDIFVAKYNSIGNIVWAKSAGGNTGDMGNGISLDANGNIFISGYFTSPTIIFGTSTLTNIGLSQIFIAKYDSNGDEIWAKSASGTTFGVGIDNSLGIAADANGNVIITGNYSNPILTFGTTSITNVGFSDVFIAKYDSSGNVAWVKSVGGSSNDQGNGITTDSYGNIYIIGYFGSPTLTFGPVVLTNSGITDIFIAKYDTSGNLIWATGPGGSDADFGYGISTDINDNIFITGWFGSTSIAFGSTSLTNTITPTIDSDVFLSKIARSLQGIEDAGMQFDFSIAPNPTTGTLNVYLANTLQQPSSFIVYDVLGSKILETKLTSDKTTLDVSQLKNGVYFVSIVSGTNNIVRKFVKL